MKIVLAPHIDVKIQPRSYESEVLDKYPPFSVSDEADRIVASVIQEAIESTPGVLEDDAELDAPPFSASWWWVATVERLNGTLVVHSFEPSHFYAIDELGRVRFEHSLSDVTVAEFARAFSEGHYRATEPTLVVTRGGEFGGNGAAVATLLGWLWDFAPEVLLTLGVERGLGWRKARKEGRIRKLADDWSASNIQHPRYLRRFVETKRRWFPSILAERLSLSESAARRLLTALGYEPGADDAMELRIGPEAMRARDTWIYGEGWPNHEMLDEDGVIED